MQIKKYKNRDWLCHQYINLKKSGNEIAKELGIAKSTAGRWIRELKIPTRKPGGYLKGKIGKNHPTWKGGKYYILQGYLVRNAIGSHGYKKIFLHNELYCKFHQLNKIPKGCVVHHIDGNPLNNSKNNLKLMKKGKHLVHHRKLKNQRKLNKQRRLK